MVANECARPPSKYYIDFEFIIDLSEVLLGTLLQWYVHSAPPLLLCLNLEENFLYFLLFFIDAFHWYSLCARDPHQCEYTNFSDWNGFNNKILSFSINIKTNSNNISFRRAFHSSRHKHTSFYSTSVLSGRLHSTTP